MKILCIDDEPNILECLVEFLEIIGHSILTAEDGQRGWQIFSDNAATLDVVITDVRMPQVDGFKLIKMIRETGSMLPIFVISGHSDDKMEKEYTQLKNVAIIAKPFDLSTIKAALENLQSTRSQGTSYILPPPH